MRKINASEMKSGDVCKIDRYKNSDIFLYIIKNRRKYFSYFEKKSKKFGEFYYWKWWDKDEYFCYLFNVKEELKKKRVKRKKS